MTITELKPMSEPFRRLEVFTGAGRRRDWSTAQRTAIVAESYSGSDTVCGVARRHGLSPSQLFTWRRLARRELAAAAEPALFVPAVIERKPEEPKAKSPRRRSPRRLRAKAALAGIELEVDGILVRVGPDAEAGAITAVIRALKASS